MSRAHAQGQTLKIGDLLLDTPRREVRRGSELLKLPRLSYRMLVCLAESAPAVVSHDELVEQVWEGRIVSPETVTQRVKLLRAALGDDAASPRYVALVRGEGYRLIATVEGQLGRSGEMATLQRVSSLATAATVSLVVAIVAAAGFYLWLVPATTTPVGAEAPARPVRSDSLAVLPFVNSSAEPDDAYLSDGISSTLTDQLDAVGELNVIARSSAVTFRSQSMDVVRIATRLGVEKIIEGRLQRDGDQVIIVASIVDGQSGFRIWTQQFDAHRSELPVLQRELAKEIIAQLKPDYDGMAAARAAGPLDPTAYDIGLLARARYEDVRDDPIVDRAKLDEAITLYSRLVELEPQSASAHSQLAAALLYAGNTVAAEGPIRRAIDIDPESAEAQYTLGLFKWMRYEEGSGEAYTRAIELNPNDPDAQEAYAKYVWHQLVSDIPETHFIQALEFDSQRLTRYADLGIFYGMSGRSAQARETAELTARRFADSNAYMAIARMLELTGAIDEAIAWALRARDAEPDRQDPTWMVAELYARIGDFEAAHQYEPERAFNLLYWERRYSEMIEAGEDLIFEQPGQPQIWYGLARAALATGQHDLAIRYLHRQDIPARSFNENRRANDNEALVTLADAYKASGDSERATEMASWFKPYLETMLNTGGDRTWWPHLYLACVNSILDDDDAALQSLENMVDAHGIPWYPLLVDEPCFRRLSGQPRYQAVVARIERKMASLRERLPLTLERLQNKWRSAD